MVLGSWVDGLALLGLSGLLAGSRVAVERDRLEPTQAIRPTGRRRMGGFRRRAGHVDPSHTIRSDCHLGRPG